MNYYAEGTLIDVSFNAITGDVMFSLMPLAQYMVEPVKGEKSVLLVAVGRDGEPKGTAMIAKDVKFTVKSSRSHVLDQASWILCKINRVHLGVTCDKNHNVVSVSLV